MARGFADHDDFGAELNLAFCVISQDCLSTQLAPSAAATALQGC